MTKSSWLLSMLWVVAHPCPAQGIFEIRYPDGNYVHYILKFPSGVRAKADTNGRVCLDTLHLTGADSDECTVEFTDEIPWMLYTKRLYRTPMGSLADPHLEMMFSLGRLPQRAAIWRYYLRRRISTLGD
jgi:hypothetical protein